MSLGSLCNVEADSTEATRRQVERHVRSTLRSRRVNSDLADLRAIESAPHGSNVFWAKWKARVRHLGDSSLADCVLDPDGQLITDPLKVLHVWKDYVHQLGTEDLSEDYMDKSDCISSPGSRFDDDFALEVLKFLRSPVQRVVASPNWTPCSPGRKCTLQSAA